MNGKKPLTSQTAPNTEVSVPTGDIRPLSFQANGQMHTGEVDLSKYSTRVVRDHIRTVQKSQAMEDKYMGEDAMFEAGIVFAMKGATSPSLPDMTVEGVQNANFAVATAFLSAVQDVVF